MADVPSDPTPLDQIVDDYAPRQEALQWATAQLADGRTFEDISAHLIQTGWTESDAAEIVEEARQQTRHYRGAVTRQQIVRASNRRYRQAMTGGWFVGFPSVTAAMRLIQALASLASLRRPRPRRPDDQSPT
jgi:hypothetical protein